MMLEEKSNPREFDKYKNFHAATNSLARINDLHDNIATPINQAFYFGFFRPKSESNSPRTNPGLVDIDDSPGFETPFDKIDEMYIDDDLKALSVIKNIPKALKFEYARWIADRLQYLYDVSKEDDPNEVAIAPESIKYFLKFFEREKLRYPDIVLTPSKNIWVEWRTGPDQHFAVEFLPTGDTHFVVFAPDPNHPAKTTRVSGMTSFDSLIGLVKQYGVLSWALL